MTAVHHQRWTGTETDSAYFIELACRDAERHAAQHFGVPADLDDPAGFAAVLPLAAQAALLSAWQVRTGWRVSDQDAAHLRRLGLVETRGPHLMTFAMRVRKALLPASPAGKVD